MERKTDWGLDIKELYTPDDIKDFDYSRDLGDPAHYPYARGFYEHGYRLREFTRHQTCGFGSASNTNKMLKDHMARGQKGGLSIIADRPSYIPIDHDHPLARNEGGVVGVALSNIRDMEDLFEGIPLQNQSITFSNWGVPGVLTQCLLFAHLEKQGIEFSKIRGGTGGSPLTVVFGNDDMHPLELGMKAVVDIIEYFARNKLSLRFALTSNNLRECGLNIGWELAILFANFKEIFSKLYDRGLSFDEFASKIYTPVSVGTRIFEEVAKMRAMRKMWAKMAKDYGAKEERSYTLILPVKTSGISLTYPQPLNNIIRGTIACLAGVLGGCSAIDMSTYDEPICEPSDQAFRLAFATQAIVAYESGATDTVDPLGGSYYIENLTKEIEKESYRCWDEIEKMGGLWASINKGWMEDLWNKAIYKEDEDLRTKKKILVGVNEMVIPPEQEIPIPISEPPPSGSEDLAKQMVEFKKSRDNEKVKTAIFNLYKDAKKGEKYNLIPAIIQAYKASATSGEIWGTIREAFGVSYDPYNRIQSPFDWRGI
jgi:methylmalonyl-CoA mutase, N-terminal domain